MKKSLIALAVLAASGAAMAQSTVTLYGRADVWLGSVKVDTAGTSTRTTKLDNGGATSSRWGMIGAEDLGGGLKANFNLEQGVAVDTGTAANFGRAAWVGLSGGFGAVKLGFGSTAFDDVSGASDAIFDSDLSPMNGADSYGNVPAVFNSVRYTSRPGNTIYYQAPNMGGFSGAISYGLDETTDTTVTPVVHGTSNTSFNLTYGAGPVAAQFAYQIQSTDGAASDIKFTRLGASYNFGVATAKLVYGSVKNQQINLVTLDKGVYLDGASTSEYLLGVDVPVSAAMTVSAAYASSSDNTKAGDTDRSGYAIGAVYNLSKRTALYGGYKSMKYDFTGVTPDTKVSILALGVKHLF